MYGTVKDLTEQLLKMYSADEEIAIDVWSQGDVQHVATQLDKTLTDEECDEVLESIGDDIDATQGITWDSVENTINEM